MMKNDITETSKCRKNCKRWSCTTYSTEETISKVRENKTPVLKESNLLKISKKLKFDEVYKRKPEDSENLIQKRMPLIVYKEDKILELFDEESKQTMMFPLIPDQLIVRSSFILNRSREISQDEDNETDEEMVTLSNQYLISQVTQSLIAESCQITKRTNFL